MKPKQPPVIAINPDIEVMKPDDFEEPDMFVVIDEPFGLKYCPHDQIRIYPHHRLIKCRNCQKVIDPFDYILTTGRQANNFLSHMKYLKIQMDRMDKEFEGIGQLFKKLKRGK